MKKLQFGRTMTEMLGVLAIIGVLSVACVWVLNKAFVIHKTNNLLEDAKRAGFVIMSDNIIKRLPLINEEQNNDVPLDNLFEKNCCK